MKKLIIKYVELGWWIVPVMALMGSPWFPFVQSVWGAHLAQAKDAMQALAPVVLVLAMGLQGRSNNHNADR